MYKDDFDIDKMLAELDVSNDFDETETGTVDFGFDDLEKNSFDFGDNDDFDDFDFNDSDSSSDDLNDTDLDDFDFGDTFDFDNDFDESNVEKKFEDISDEINYYSQDDLNEVEVEYEKENNQNDDDDLSDIFANYNSKKYEENLKEEIIGFLTKPYSIIIGIVLLLVLLKFVPFGSFFGAIPNPFGKDEDNHIVNEVNYGNVPIKEVVEKTDDEKLKELINNLEYKYNNPNKFK